MIVLLSRREWLVAMLTADGFSRKEMALVLSITATTVNGYSKRARNKYRDAGRRCGTAIEMRECLAADGYLSE